MIDNLKKDVVLGYIALDLISDIAKELKLREPDISKRLLKQANRGKEHLAKWIKT